MPHEDRERSTNSILDPEALVLMSLALADREKRLVDMLGWWAKTGAIWLSTLRLKTLLNSFPRSVEPRVGWFASLCQSHHGPRFNTLAGLAGETVTFHPRDKGPDELRFLDPSTLMLRFRAGFGVGAKPDMLTFLLGIAAAHGKPEIYATAETISRAISYTATSVRRAAADMALAGFVRATTDRPVEYGVVRIAWTEMFRLQDPRVPRRASVQEGRTPVAYGARQREGLEDGADMIRPWNYYAQLYGFLAQTIAWAQGASGRSAVVSASLARDLVEEHSRALRLCGITAPDPQFYRGGEYLHAFGDLVAAVAIAIEERK